MEHERIMLGLAAQGRILMFGGGGGGHQAPPPPPDPVQSPAVQVADSAKGKYRSLLARRRQTRSGQMSMRTGGSAGGAQGGQTLMGS